MPESDFSHTTDTPEYHMAVRSDISRRHLELVYGLQKEERGHGLRDSKTMLRFMAMTSNGPVPCVLTHVYVTNFHETHTTGSWTITGFLAREIAPTNECFVLIVYYPEEKWGYVYTTPSELKKAKFPHTSKRQTPGGT